MSSGYVLAGFEILTTIIDAFLFSPNFKRNFSREDLRNFFENKCAGMLHSFGTNFNGRKKFDKFVKKEIRILNYCKDIGFYGNTEFILDSGGYQASIGIFDNRDTDILYNLYYQFLNDHSDKYDRAFILDLPPGPGCKLFKSFKEVYELNRKSYLEASNFSKEIRDKIIYIYHFRTPKLWDIYTKILDDNNLFEKFNNFGTGGIVANMATDLIIPCIIYTIPLVPLLRRAKAAGRKQLNFHILGGSGFRDLLFYELFKIHVKKIHGIELTITYDSSGIFKALMIGRFIHIVKDESVFKTNIRTSNLNMRHKNSNMKIIDLYRESLNDFADENNFRRIKLDSIYSSKTGTFHEDVRLYSMLYVLSNYSKMESILNRRAQEIYTLYSENRIAKFNNEIENITRKLNSEKITKKQKAKSSCVSKSLDMLTHLDDDYCKYLINKFLMKDEFNELRKNKREMPRF